MQRRHLAAAALFLALTALLAAAAAVEAARSAPRPQHAGAFAARVVSLIAANDYADAWELLHPLHQADAPRAEYVDCEQRQPIPGRLKSVRVLGIRNESVGLDNGTVVRSEAVTVRIAIDGGAFGVAVVTDTVHAIVVHGAWRWILPAWRADLYRSGRCPDGSPASPLPAV